MDRSMRAALTDQRLTRSYPAQFEVREIGDGGNRIELTGYASVSERPYEMFDLFGGYTEVVRSGAFAGTLAAKPDVAYLANHTGLTMARTAAGSLRLEEDSRGLLTVAQVNLERSDVRDLVTAIRDGDIDQMSFMFRINEEQWSSDFDQRQLLHLNLDKGDVSAVNFGANPSTKVATRSVPTVRLLQMRMACR